MCFSQNLEMEMARQQSSFQDFNEAAQKVAENVDEDSPSVKQIQDQMEEFNERWNTLTTQVTQRLALVGRVLLESGLKFSSSAIFVCDLVLSLSGSTSLR